MTRIDEIRARCDAATPGPWVWPGGGGPAKNIIGNKDNRPVIVLSRCKEADAEFMAHSREDIPYLLGKIEHLQKEIDRYARWVNDLQSGMYVNCVYCGHRYGPADEAPTSMSAALTEHIENCPEHPMSKLRTENALLRAECEAAQEAADDAMRERNAAVEDLRYTKLCRHCKHGKNRGPRVPPCDKCADDGKLNWQWRGLQGEGG
ncbi:hypothetical protein LJC42_00205 [Eubacteriales bacterium OttesenSCG-928-K08]|nr:hypothetical protein [Eubacteriales bacterium OttesenSCG-928-K08]